MAQLRALAKTELVDKKALVYASMGGIAETQGDPAQAIADYRRAHESEPDNDGYTRKLAYLLHRANRFSEALALYRGLEQKQADDIQLIRDMAIVYAQLGDLGQARRYFEKALRRSPDANLYFNFALLLARQGEYGKARAMMEKFLAAAPAGLRPGPGGPALPRRLEQAVTAAARQGRARRPFKNSGFCYNIF